MNWPFAVTTTTTTTNTDEHERRAHRLENEKFRERVIELVRCCFSFETDVRLSDVRYTALHNKVKRLQFAPEEVSSDLFASAVETAYQQVYSDWPHGVEGFAAIGELVFD